MFPMGVREGLRVMKDTQHENALSISGDRRIQLWKFYPGNDFVGYQSDFSKLGIDYS